MIVWLVTQLLFSYLAGPFFVSSRLTFFNKIFSDSFFLVAHSSQVIFRFQLSLVSLSQRILVPCSITHWSILGFIYPCMKRKLIHTTRIRPHHKKILILGLVTSLGFIISTAVSLHVPISYLLELVVVGYNHHKTKLYKTQVSNWAFG